MDDPEQVLSDMRDILKGLPEKIAERPSYVPTRMASGSSTDLPKILPSRPVEVPQTKIEIPRPPVPKEMPEKSSGRLPYMHQKSSSDPLPNLPRAMPSRPVGIPKERTEQSATGVPKTMPVGQSQVPVKNHNPVVPAEVPKPKGIFGSITSGIGSGIKASASGVKEMAGGGDDLSDKIDELIDAINDLKKTMEESRPQTQGVNAMKTASYSAPKEKPKGFFGAMGGMSKGWLKGLMGGS